MKKTTSTIARGAAIAGAGLGAQAALNAFLCSRGGVLPPGLPGEQRTYDWRLGQIRYAVAGQGPPLVLLHGIGAGCSSFEWRRNFDALSSRFQVYAPDLLGWGLSERPAMEHSGRFYVQLIDDFIRSIVTRPANIVASSHSAAYAFRLAYTRPELITSIIAICPVGMGPGMGEPIAKLGALIGIPILGDSAYYALTSRANMARTLREEVYADAGLVDDPLIDRYYNAAHQPGARYAISSFLKGDLNIPIQDEFKRLKQPILLVWGAESTYTPLSQARAFQEANSTAILHVLQDSRQVPHDEKADEFNKLALSWLQPLTADQELRIL